jgi:isoquinoline 1-oxidoreductase alpha subunit
MSLTIEVKRRVRRIPELFMSTSFVLNGKPATLDADPRMPLLWAVREFAGLPGTKFGCGMALCGACTVHLDGKPIRSCVTPLSAVAGRNVTTIEGLSGTPAKAVQAAWVKLQVPQCGYCQSGQIMAATALLKQNLHPGDAEIDAAMSGNICRCATYPRIRAAIKRAAKEQA